jgi:hypothetical protein
MALKHPRAHTRPVHHHPVAPLFGMEPGTIPRHHLPGARCRPEVAAQIIRDELMLDGNARLNLATWRCAWCRWRATASTCPRRRWSRPAVRRLPGDRQAVGAGRAGYGYCAAHSRWYWG